MNHIIITSYGEVNSTERAISSFIKQVPENFKIIVSDPFPETKWMIEEKFPNNDKIIYIEDEDKGKSNALNSLFKKFTTKYINHQLSFLL